MSENKINSLTPEQEALIPVYREKWRAIALSTEPIDRQKAAEAVKAAYALIGKKEPEILFFDSPYAAWNQLLLPHPVKQIVRQRGGELETQLSQQIFSKLWKQVRREISKDVINKIMNVLRIVNQIESRIQSIIRIQGLANLKGSLEGDIILQGFTLDGSFYDVCFSILNCKLPQQNWEIFKSFSDNCGWLIPFKKICFVCDRPRVLSFDNQQRLHAEGSPAIQFADGFSVYAYHGVRLPEKYGKLHPNEWRSQWLLEETNAELRRVLIQGIGYDRISQELQAIELDSWQEYTLTKIDNAQDEEPMYLLKMTCPSTGFIHALRVPPDINSAREAIRWVNWGIDPEEFSVQT